MKKINLLILFSSSTLFLSAQWMLNDRLTENNLNAIAFADSLSGYAVGDSATILQTLNAGKSWHKYTTTTGFETMKLNLNTVAFANSDTGYFFSDAPNTSYNSLYAFTLNSGNNWNLESASPMKLNTEILHVVEPEVVLFTGSKSDMGTGLCSGAPCKMLIKKSNEATLVGSWYHVNATLNNNATNEHVTGYDIDFFHHDSGYATGSNNSLVYTTDVGETWVDISPSLFYGVEDSVDYYAIDVVENKKVFIAGRYRNRGIILSSIDPINTWDTITFGEIVNDIKFIDNQIGYTVGQNGLILKTTDGGQNWLEEESFVTNNLNEIYINLNNVYIVGDSGTILDNILQGNIEFNTAMLDDTFCVGDTVFLNNTRYNPLLQYEWYVDTAFYSNVKDTFYVFDEPGSVIGYSNFYLLLNDSLAMDSITLNYYFPIADFSIIEDTIQIDQGITLNSSMSILCDSVVWELNGKYVSSDQILTMSFDSIGMNTIKLIGYNFHCNTESMIAKNIIVVDSISTEINSVNLSNALFTIWPNPAKKYVTIRILGLGNFDEKYVLSISNVLGQVLYMKEYKHLNDPINEEINLNGIERGIYNVTIHSDKRFKSKLLFVE